MSLWNSGDSLTPSTLNRKASSGLSSAITSGWNVFNVRDYGALGIGTDDTASVQAAVDAAISANGGTVLFPAGAYRITSAIQFGVGVRCVGTAWDTSIGTTGSVIVAAFSGYAFKPKTALVGAINVTGVVFENLKVHGDTGTAAAPGAIDLTSCAGACLRNVFYGTTGTPDSTGVAYLIASSGQVGGLNNVLDNTVAAHIGSALSCVGTTNQNNIYNLRSSSCSTGARLTGSHNILINPDLESSSMCGVEIGASGTENVIIGLNADANGTAFGILDSGTSNYVVGPHFSSLGTNANYGTGTVVLDSVNGSQHPSVLSVNTMGGVSGITVAVGGLRVLAPGTVILPDGTSTSPAIAFSNDTTLGFWRTGSGTIASSYGTLDVSSGGLALNRVAFSSGTTAQSASTAKVGQGQVLFSVLSLTTNGAALYFRSGNSTYVWPSSGVIG